LTRLSGKTAIVTGAASGIGRATARRMAACGAAVVLADIDADGLRATDAAGAAVLSGSVARVLDGARADVLLLPASTAHGTGLFLVDADAPGVERRSLTTMDQTRRLASVVLDRAPAIPLQREPAGAAALLERVSSLAWVALACEQVGGAQRCLDLASEHARTRTQFGVPIGTFQAVKHACADMLASVELARSVAGHAAWCADHDPADLPVMARAAKSLCSETYRQAAATTVQIHGGLGFTWAHPAHLYFKRAKSSELLFGHPVEHRDVLGRLLGLTDAVVPSQEDQQV
jgi:alkylation response protein AidB-like acyl-CoA dehydrogenase